MSDNPRHMHNEARRVRYLGSAKSGTAEAQAMRVSSLALIPLTFAFVWVVLQLIGRDYDSARAYLHHPFPALILLLFIGTSIYHMQLGMRSIIDDYVHGAHAKEWTLAANLFFAVIVGVACLYAVLRLSFS